MGQKSPAVGVCASGGGVFCLSEKFEDIIYTKDVEELDGGVIAEVVFTVD